jgi:hypothetical protein
MMETMGASARIASRSARASALLRRLRYPCLKLYRDARSFQMVLQNDGTRVRPSREGVSGVNLGLCWGFESLPPLLLPLSD